ncbi:hypothetical protein BC828DRAFT_382292 [Blastocladiella britannica]|nr:hypothetical protein BC828DRAFT_382292 [Blastocladiella britannica]
MDRSNIPVGIDELDQPAEALHALEPTTAPQNVGSMDNLRETGAAGASDEASSPVHRGRSRSPSHRRSPSSRSRARSIHSEDVTAQSTGAPISAGSVAAAVPSRPISPAGSNAGQGINTSLTNLLDVEAADPHAADEENGAEEPDPVVERHSMRSGVEGPSHSSLQFGGANGGPDLYSSLHEKKAASTATVAKHMSLRRIVNVTGSDAGSPGSVSGSGVSMSVNNNNNNTTAAGQGWHGSSGTGPHRQGRHSRSSSASHSNASAMAAATLAVAVATPLPFSTAPGSGFVPLSTPDTTRALIDLGSQDYMHQQQQLQQQRMASQPPFQQIEGTYLQPIAGNMVGSGPVIPPIPPGHSRTASWQPNREAAAAQQQTSPDAHAARSAGGTISPPSYLAAVHSTGTAASANRDHRRDSDLRRRDGGDYPSRDRHGHGGSRRTGIESAAHESPAARMGARSTGDGNDDMDDRGGRGRSAANLGSGSGLRVPRESPEDYLHEMVSKLSRREWGTSLTGRKEVQGRARTILCRHFKFKNMSLDLAFRKFCLAISLPIESQQIARLLMSFAERYAEENPDLYTVEEVDSICHCMLLEHTLLHNRKGKSRLMTTRDGKTPIFVDAMHKEGRLLELVALAFHNNLKTAELILAEDDNMMDGQGRIDYSELNCLEPDASKVRGSQTRQMYYMMAQGVQSTIWSELSPLVRVYYDSKFKSVPDTLEGAAGQAAATAALCGGPRDRAIVPDKPPKLLRREAKVRAINTSVQVGSRGAVATAGAEIGGNGSVPQGSAKVQDRSVGFIQHGSIKRVPDKALIGHEARTSFFGWAGRGGGDDGPVDFADFEDVYLALTGHDVILWKGKAAAKMQAHFKTLKQQPLGSAQKQFKAPQPSMIAPIVNSVAVHGTGDNQLARLEEQKLTSNVFRICISVPRVQMSLLPGMDASAVDTPEMQTREYLFYTRTEGIAWQWVTNFNAAAALQYAGIVGRTVIGGGGVAPGPAGAAAAEVVEDHGADDLPLNPVGLSASPSMDMSDVESIYSVVPSIYSNAPPADMHHQQHHGAVVGAAPTALGVRPPSVSRQGSNLSKRTLQKPPTIQIPGPDGIPKVIVDASLHPLFEERRRPRSRRSTSSSVESRDRRRTRTRSLSPQPPTPTNGASGRVSPYPGEKAQKVPQTPVPDSGVECKQPGAGVPHQPQQQQQQQCRTSALEDNFEPKIASLRERVENATRNWTNARLEFRKLALTAPIERTTAKRIIAVCTQLSLRIRMLAFEEAQARAFIHVLETNMMGRHQHLPPAAVRVASSAGGGHQYGAGFPMATSSPPDLDPAVAGGTIAQEDPAAAERIRTIIQANLPKPTGV